MPPDPASLNDKLIVAAVTAVATFVFTGVLGAMWTFALSQSAWKRQSKQALYQQRYHEGVAFLDSLSRLIGKRFFLLQRLIWAFREADAARIQVAEEKYFRAVFEWNFTYWLNRNKIRLLVSEVQAEEFLSYDDDRRPDNPRSLHYAFSRAHRLVMAVKSDSAKLQFAEEAVTKLNWKCSTFLERLTTEFLAHAASLSLLKVPESHLPDDRPPSKK